VRPRSRSRRSSATTDSALMWSRLAVGSSARRTNGSPTDHQRITNEATCHRDPLLLPSAHLDGHVTGSVGQVDLVEEFIGTGQRNLAFDTSYE
jgi:hypothetical protein